MKTEHGFDMSSSVQIVIDLAEKIEILAPSILAAIEMILLYRIQKKQNAISEKETTLHEKELELEKEKHLLERAKAERSEFEVRMSSNGESEILIKTSDIRLLQNDPKKLSQFMDSLKSALGLENEFL